MSEQTLIPPIYNLRRPGDLRKQQARLRRVLAKNIHEDKKSQAAFIKAKDFQNFIITPNAKSELQISFEQNDHSTQYNQALNNLKTILPPYQASNVLRSIDPIQFNRYWPGFHKHISETTNLNEKYFRSHWKHYLAKHHT